MKLFNIKNIDKFFEIVDSCEKVELVSNEGDVINLKSNFCKYFSLSKMLSDGNIIKQLELKVYNSDDMLKFIKFMEEEM